jgi:diguanylate cyclase (GGDEF)-like protein
MQQAWQRASAEHRPLAVMLLDIDHFKSINDRFGHASGDAVLVRVGEILQACVRRGDLVARWGGEEFLVLLPDASLEEAREISERIRLEIARTAYSEQRLRVSATIGVAAWCASESLDATIHRADTLLYRGKHQGRDRVVAQDATAALGHQQLAS